MQRKKTIKDAKLKIAKTRKLEQLNITVKKESNSFEDSDQLSLDKSCSVPEEFRELADLERQDTNKHGSNKNMVGALNSTISEDRKKKKKRKLMKSSTVEILTKEDPFFGSQLTSELD